MTVSLVTGGAGFIGSHVVDHLIKMGHKVIVLDNLSGGSSANVPVESINYVVDIRDDEMVNDIIAEHKPDYIFHLAAYAAEGLSHFIRRYNYEVNVIGSINLINAAVNYGVKRFVFTSSVAVYGLNAHGADEHQTPTPIDPYGIAKWTVELDLMAAGRMFDLEFTVFRPGNVYGPRQNLNDGYRNACGIFMRQCLLDQPMTIYGDGRQMRQFTYIDDVAPYIAGCVDIQRTIGHIYNLGSDQQCSVNSLSAEVAFALGKALNEVHMPERFEAWAVYVDHTKADEHFRIASKTSLSHGIARMAEWAKTQPLHDPKPFADIEIEKKLPDIWRKLHVNR